ncbi:MAG: hypothetical protein OEM67_03425 [Thermoleophilia bacterium]|nr:hypothetical protein [Thermoleophilia bacterium]MDH3724489.1 hypothetical protein [Thermoleophilia bacterium]
MCALPTARQLVWAAAATLLLGAGSARAAEVDLEVPPDAPSPDLAKDGLHSDPALETGWVRTFFDREPLLRGPGGAPQMSPSARPDALPDGSCGYDVARKAGHGLASASEEACGDGCR